MREDGVLYHSPLVPFIQSAGDLLCIVLPLVKMPSVDLTILLFLFKKKFFLLHL